jgi:hypothetical protein
MAGIQFIQEEIKNIMRLRAVEEWKMQNSAFTTLKKKDRPPSTERSFTLFRPLRGLDDTPWRQKFLNELPTDTHELVAAVLKHRGSGLLLAHFSNRPGTANTAADLAHLVGVSEETLEPILKWLKDRGFVETLCVEGTIFFKLTKDQTRCKHVHLFRERRDSWLEQMRNMTAWLEGKLPG